MGTTGTSTATILQPGSIDAWRTRSSYSILVTVCFKYDTAHIYIYIRSAVREPRVSACRISHMSVDMAALERVCYEVRAAGDLVLNTLWDMDGVSTIKLLA